MSGTDHESSLAPGFHRLQVLYRGVASTIYRAERDGTNVPAALKVMRDADGAAEIDHLRALSGNPGVVRVLGRGQTSSGRHFVAMEYLADGDLQALLRRGNGLPVDEVVEAGIAASAALDAVHQAGLLHHDVEPANLLRGDGSVVLADFGSVLPAGTTPEGVGPDPYLVPHAPPEALRGEAASPASDVYRLASTLWTLLAGHPPFSEDPDGPIDPFRYRERALGTPPPRLPRSDIPQALRTVLDRALAKDPTKRYPGVGEFAADLEGVTSAASTAVPAGSVGTVPGLVGEAESATEKEPVGDAPSGPHAGGGDTPERDTGTAPDPTPPAAPDHSVASPAASPGGATADASPGTTADSDGVSDRDAVTHGFDAHDQGAPSSAAGPDNASEPGPDAPPEGHPDDAMERLAREAWSAAIGSAAGPGDPVTSPHQQGAFDPQAPTPPVGSRAPQSPWDAPNWSGGSYPPPMSPPSPAPQGFPAEPAPPFGQAPTPPPVPPEPSAPAYSAPPPRPIRRRPLYIAVAVVSIAVLSMAAGAVALLRPSLGGDVLDQIGVGAEESPSPAASDEPESPPAPSPSVNSADLAPADVEITEDAGHTVWLSWTDNTDGEASHHVVGASAGAMPSNMADVEAGETEARVSGLNTAQDYCFTVIAVSGVDEIGESDEACTERDSSG